MPKKNIRRISRRQENEHTPSKKQLNFFDNSSDDDNKMDETQTTTEEYFKNKNELYEEKFLNYMDNATEKSSQTRITSLHGICEILMHKYCPDFLDDRKITLTDIIEKSLRKGKGQELMWSAHLITLLQLQLGSEIDLTNDFNPSLIQLINDTATEYNVRTKCCTALGTLNFLCDNDSTSTLEIMETMTKVFNDSVVIDGEKINSNNIPVEAAVLHSEALIGWGLLLTSMSASDMDNLLENSDLHKSIPNIEKLIGLLKSTHLDIRMAAGEVIALLYEKAKQTEQETQIFNDNLYDDLIDIVKSLATDSNKYRAKKDRKTQRAVFRDLLKFLEDGIEPALQIRFGTEYSILNTWAAQHQYTALCSITGPGITSHLQQNDIVRDIFKIESSNDSSIDKCDLKWKQSANEKRLINAAAFKARTISRAKDRDYRNSAIF